MIISLKKIGPFKHCKIKIMIDVISDHSKIYPSFTSYHSNIYPLKKLTIGYKNVSYIGSYYI